MSDADARNDGITPEPGHAGQAMARLLARALPEEELREQTGRVARPARSERDRVRRIVTMRLGPERLALPALDVARVTEAAPVHRVPHRGGQIVRGLCNIGGELVLVAALDRLLHIEHAEDAPADQARMVVIGEAGARWAFVVDAVEGVEVVDAVSLRGLPVTVAQALVHFAEAIVPLPTSGGEGQATLLDPKRIAAALEATLA